MTGADMLLRLEPVALVIVLIVFVSLAQGFFRGASGSAKGLFLFIWEGILLIVSLIAAGWLAEAGSKYLQRFLAANVSIPERELGSMEQLWYTLVTSVRDFALLRFGIVFLVSYMVFRFLLGFLTPLVWALLTNILVVLGYKDRPTLGRAMSRVSGALIGTLHGTGRSFVLLAILFIYVSLFPTAPFVDGIKASPVYMTAASKLLEPASGGVFEDSGPVITKAAGTELRQILQRKYEIIDYNIPTDISEAANTIVAGKSSDIEKARALYDWLGTRIAYDWDKSSNYVDKGVWKEQTPEETFHSRKGVCIDTARLYAVMARSVGLEVQVVTGQGADGKGDFGAHAWNEVKLADEGGKWLPLDATWASSGDWFGSRDFDQTHIKGV